jgi:hypothetical protein
MTKFIITTSGISCKIYWMETQESPAKGIWVTNNKKATLFSSEKTANRYIKKYDLRSWTNSQDHFVEKVEVK